MRRRVALAGAVCVCFLATSAVASAAVRYASPTGVPSPVCEAATPCDLVTAVNSAGSNDEVIVAPGTYSVASELEVFDGLDVHGQAGQPRPVINTTAFNGVGVSAARVAGLDVIHTGTNLGIIMYDDALAERMVVRSLTEHACFGRGTIRDSVCHTTAPGHNAVLLSLAGTATLTLRHVTAVSDTHAAIVAQELSPGMTVSIDAKDVIALGSAFSGSVQDVLAITADATATASVALDHSNYDSDGVAGPGTESVTPAGAGTNQNAAPVFVDAAAGNFRQASGSPTIDAGALDAQSGGLDLDGSPRSLGAAPDIGAHEFVPPAPPDRTPPQLTLTAKRKQKLGKRIVVKATCADEACAATATGKLAVKASPKRFFRLRAASRNLAAGRPGKLKLKVPRAARNEALEAFEAGGKATAKIKVVATDPARNRAKARTAVRLREP